jgi:uncharacterized tellurite resistance protein B-like protein
MPPSGHGAGPCHILASRAPERPFRSAVFDPGDIDPVRRLHYRHNWNGRWWPMFERVLSFLRDLPGGASGGRASSADDPRVAASALLYHVMNADGVRQDAEVERFKTVLAETYGIGGAELEALAEAGELADKEAVDLYAFTSVLKRHLGIEARKAFVGLMWQIVYADGELHELEDNVVWRVAELLDVEGRDRIEARRRAAAHAPDPKNAPDR